MCTRGVEPRGLANAMLFSRCVRSGFSSRSAAFSLSYTSPAAGTAAVSVGFCRPGRTTHPPIHLVVYLQQLARARQP